MNVGKFLTRWFLVGSVLLFDVSPVFAQVTDVREYVIGIGDQLDILVWGIPELSSKVAVRLDGKITMPRLGDFQAAGLKVSSLKAYLAGEEEGKETIGKYVKNPNITISVVRPAENIRVTISGVVSQVLNVPRQTQIGQVLKQLVPQLPSTPPPELQNIRVLSAEGEEFFVNWPEVQSGRAPNMDVRLEWGDEIRIPAGTLPEATPIPQSTPSPPPQVNYSEEELQQLLHEYPDALEQVIAAASGFDGGIYHFDLADMSAEQQETLGEDIIALLFYGSVDAVPKVFTNALLVGITVNLALDEMLEAYLAFPDPSPETLPAIRRFHEGDLIEKGSGEDEDVYLEEILDEERTIIVRQGDERQLLSLASSISEATLAGIFESGDGPKAVFSNLQAPESRKPRKRMFLQGERIEDDVKVAKISRQWVMLQKGEDIQLLLLRDSLNRPLPAIATPPPVPGADVELEENGELSIPQDGMEQLLQNLPQGALQRVLPDELKALDTFSKLFFATPIFE